MLGPNLHFFPERALDDCCLGVQLRKLDHWGNKIHPGASPPCARVHVLLSHGTRRSSGQGRRFGTGQVASVGRVGVHHLPNPFDPGPASRLGRVGSVGKIAGEADILVVLNVQLSGMGCENGKLRHFRPKLIKGMHIFRLDKNLRPHFVVDLLISLHPPLGHDDNSLTQHIHRQASKQNGCIAILEGLGMVAVHGGFCVEGAAASDCSFCDKHYGRCCLAQQEYLREDQDLQAERHTCGTSSQPVAKTCPQSVVVVVCLG
mmetsp:Transcript_34643/g.54091  ORF Transcript_34643/g.54091 Transcript_34643/m.54091 type:complete len:260 (-) Transcript_34643:510-1289(-)